MFLIVGLGNIGSTYHNNRHNIGFLFLDFISKSMNINTFVNKSTFFSSEIQTKYNNHTAVLIKPNTFMNLSGKSILKYKNFYKVDDENIIVIHDDLDLEFASIKYKIAGGSGGHNGLKSCDEFIGNNYFRIRLGIGRPEYNISDYVLSDFSNAQLNTLQDTIFKYAENALIAYMNKEDINQIKSKYTYKE